MLPQQVAFGNSIVLNALSAASVATREPSQHRRR